MAKMFRKPTSLDHGLFSEPRAWNRIPDVHQHEATVRLRAAYVMLTQSLKTWRQNPILAMVWINGDETGHTGVVVTPYAFIQELPSSFLGRLPSARFLLVYSVPLSKWQDITSNKSWSPPSKSLPPQTSRSSSSHKQSYITCDDTHTHQLSVSSAGFEHTTVHAEAVVAHRFEGD
jgi:hypothetical protein